MLAGDLDALPEDAEPREPIPPSTKPLPRTPRTNQQPSADDTHHAREERAIPSDDDQSDGPKLPARTRGTSPA
jgi:hypothetical protein